MARLIQTSLLLLVALGLATTALDALPVIAGRVTINTVGGRFSVGDLDTHICYSFSIHVSGQITSFDFSLVPGSVKLWIGDRCAGTMWAFAQSSGGLVGPEYQFTSLAIFNEADNANNRLDIQGYKTVTKGVAIAVTPSGPITLTNPRTHECFTFDSPHQNSVVDYTSASAGALRLFSNASCAGSTSDFAVAPAETLVVDRTFRSFAVFDTADVASSNYGTIGMNVSVPQAISVTPVPSPTTLAENPLTPAMEGKNVTLVLGTNGAVTLRSPRFCVCYTFSRGDRMPLVWYDFSQLKDLAKRVLMFGPVGCRGPEFPFQLTKSGPVNPDYTFQSLAIFYDEADKTIYHYTGECSS
jgi:hypothetical protein